MKRRFLAFALAGFVALPAIAAPADDARRLRIEAAALVRAAAKAGSAQERQDLLRKAAGKLADLRKRYPSEPSRLRLYLGGKRISLSSDDMLAEERAAIRRAEEKRRAAARKAEEKKRAAARKAEEKKRLAARKAAEARLARLWPAGKQFRDCADCPQMVVIPAGSFTMGFPPNERHYSSEGPQHRVTIPRPFAVGKYEVTFAQWDACVSAGGCRHRPNDGGWGRGPRPVMNVSWRDAKQYVGWLSRKTGKRYRLLSESEWEYAARAGTTGPFHFGPTISTDRANYNGKHTYSSGRQGIYRRKTVPVGRFPANRFGLHDMHGNVQEWVEDCWHLSYRGAPSDGSAWTTGRICYWRVLRGGSWRHGPRELRSATRKGLAIERRSNYRGFRVAWTLAP